MNGIGVIFDIDELGGGFYGSQAWRIFMRNLPPVKLIGCTLKEGDTNATLGGSRREFCIAAFGPTLDLNEVKKAFTDCTFKGLASIDRRFITPPQLNSEPLVDAGVIDSMGRLVQDKWSRMFHDRCKDCGWGFAPRSVTVNLTPELMSELESLRNRTVPLVGQEMTEQRAEELEGKLRKADWKRKQEEAEKKAEQEESRVSQTSRNEARQLASQLIGNIKSGQFSEAKLDELLHMADAQLARYEKALAFLHERNAEDWTYYQAEEVMRIATGQAEQCVSRSQWDHMLRHHQLELRSDYLAMFEEGHRAFAEVRQALLAEMGNTRTDPKAGKTTSRKWWQIWK